MENLRRYLETGGFLYVDDDYGLDQYIRPQLERIFPDEDLIELPADHPIYSNVYNFPNGRPPKVHEHDNGAPQAFGLFHEGRMVLLYTYESNPSDGWAYDEHDNPQNITDAALQFGVNLLVYALGESVSLFIYPRRTIAFFVRRVFKTSYSSSSKPKFKNGMSREGVCTWLPYKLHTMQSKLISRSILRHAMFLFIATIQIIRAPFSKEHFDDQISCQIGAGPDSEVLHEGTGVRKVKVLKHGRSREETELSPDYSSRNFDVNKAK